MTKDTNAPDEAQVDTSDAIVNATNDGTGDAPNAAEELVLLKERATQMGVKFSPKIGVDALRDKITNALSDDPVPDEDEDENADVADAENTQSTPTAGAAATRSNPSDAIKAKAAYRKEIILEQMALVRVHITNLNPLKKDLSGEIFTVGNKYVGTVRKFIPYGDESENGYHIPKILYNQLKSRRYLSITTRRGKNSGEIIVDQKWAPEFSLEILPPLTADELKSLAGNQMAASGSN